MSAPLYIGSTMQVMVSNVTIDGSYANSGSGAWYLYLSANLACIACGALTYVTASTGNYSGNIANTTTANLTNLADYELGVSFYQNPDGDARRISCTAQYRGRT